MKTFVSRQRSPGDAALRNLKTFIFAALTVVVAPALASLPDRLEQEAADAKSRLCSLYAIDPGSYAKPVDISVVANRSDVTAPWADLPSYAAGAAQPYTGRIIIILGRTGPYPFGDEMQTLRHELSHVLLYRSLGYAPPRWFDEGLAMRAAGEWGWSDEWYATLALPRVASGRWNLSKVDQDFAGGESAVRGSYALARGFVRDLFPDDASVRGFVIAARQAGSVEAAFRRRFGISPDRAFSEWAKHLPWWAEVFAMFTGPGAIWGAVTALFLLAVLVAFRRRLRWRRRWEEEEGEEKF